VALRHLILSDKLFDIGKIRIEWQLEETMDGDTGSIDGSHTGRSQYDMTFVAVLVDIVQKSSFTSSSLTGEEERHRGLLDIATCEFYLWVHFNL